MLNIGTSFRALPASEQLRVHCVTAVVLDSILLVLNLSLTLVEGRDAVKEECHEAVGYRWHNILVICVTITTVMAFSGIVVHSKIACAPNPSLSEIRGVSSFSCALVFWSLVSTILEAIAYRAEPAVCSAMDTPTRETMGETLWEMVYITLNMVWLVVNVYAGILGKRCEEQHLRSSKGAGETGIGGNLEVVGVPLPGGVSQDVLGMGLTVAQGMPCQSGDRLGLNSEKTAH